jgi:hypothetical protein
MITTMTQIMLVINIFNKCGIRRPNLDKDKGVQYILLLFQDMARGTLTLVNKGYYYITLVRFKKTENINFTT